MSRRDSGRRYTIRFGAAMAAYVVLLLAGMAIARAIPESPWRYAAVLLPLPAVVAAAWALWRYIVEADELQSRQLLEALGIAVAGTVISTFTYGMLQNVGAPPVSWVWVTTVLMGWFGIGALLTHRRYR